MNPKNLLYYDDDDYYEFNPTLTFANYTLLIICILILLLEEYNQYRAWFLIISAFMIQIITCNYLTKCHGISIIYSFILGFLIKKYFDEKLYTKAILMLLFTLFILFIILFYFIRLRNKDLILSFFYHIIFIFIGMIYTFIPNN